MLLTIFNGDDVSQTSINLQGSPPSALTDGGRADPPAWSVLHPLLSSVHQGMDSPMEDSNDHGAWLGSFLPHLVWSST